jgi:hypothetical protein
MSEMADDQGSWFDVAVLVERDSATDDEKRLITYGMTEQDLRWVVEVKGDGLVGWNYWVDDRHGVDRRVAGSWEVDDRAAVGQGEGSAAASGRSLDL